MKRIFVAIPISEELQKGILEWEKYLVSRFLLSKGQLKNRGSSMALPSGPVRWLTGKNLHITLIPPWYEDDIVAVAAKIRDAVLPFELFEIAFKRVNFGPNPREPRLIWAENIAPRKMIDLKDTLEKEFKIESDYKPWTMHATLARFKPETFSSFPIKKLDEVIYWPEKVGSIVLMESHLSPAGADYEVLEEIKLGI